jgi:hypothetical protein
MNQIIEKLGDSAVGYLGHLFTLSFILIPSFDWNKMIFIVNVSPEEHF